MTRFNRIAYILLCLLALTGLGEATYLTVLAITGETAVCGGSAGCAQVLGSPYARIAGFPVASFGVIGYFTVFALATLVVFDYQSLRKFLALTVSAMFAFTLWLFFVQAFWIHSFCRYCLFSAALVSFMTGIIVATSSSESDRGQQ